MPAIHLVIRHFADVTAAEESRLLGLLTDTDEENIARHPDLKRRQQLARAWRRELLAQALNAPAADLRFVVAEQGKPSLADHALSFNLAHSDEAFVLAWSTDQIDIGIDVEDRAKQRRAQQTLVRRSFHVEEQRVWQDERHSALQAHIQWLTTWTRKEAILKAHGMGIRLDLHELNTENHDDSAAHPLLGQWRYQSLVLALQVVSVAWPADLQDVQLIQAGL
jgi:4'-phosphopantetheinyl transferase